MRIVEIIIRTLLGLNLAFSGLNKFANWMHPELNDQALEMMGGLMASNFVIPTVAIVEIVAAILLITGKFKLLTYMLLLPVIFGIVAFHISANDWAGIGGAAMVAVLFIALLTINKSKLKPLFK